MKRLGWARNLLGQEPGRDNRYAHAASIPTVAPEAQHGNASHHRLTPPDGKKLSFIAVKGRAAWALDQLIAAGTAGCTPLADLGLRWSAYVHGLRRLGARIETVHERHGGAYPGTQGRYVLRCDARRAGP